MFRLVTDLTEITEYPGQELAALYKWRGMGQRPRCARPGHAWTAPARGPGRCSAPRTPHLGRQELAAWAAGTEMTRGVARDAAFAAVPARKAVAPGSPSGPATSPMPAAAARSLPRSAPAGPATRP
jgi:hypothetical protein